MGRISHLIPSFVNGISQQAPALRLATQVEDCVNGYPSIVQGMTKRAPFRHIKKVSASTVDNPYVHIINRDENERYAVLMYNGSLNVFDLAGNAKTVNYGAGAAAYLSAAVPRTGFAAMTVADHTFIVNKGKVCGMDSTEVAETQSYVAIVWVKRGVAKTKYAVILNGVEYATTTTDVAETYQTDAIAAALVAAIGANATCVRLGSVIKVSKVTNFTIRTTDSYGDQGMSSIKDEAQKFLDLPARCWDGIRIKITGDVEKGTDNYYVEFETNSDYGTGVWKESRGWSQENKIDAATMPYKLVRQANGEFNIEKISWMERLIGDDDTCPVPSFIDNTIEDVFFYRNRLGLISKENIILSKAGDYYNFFPSSALALNDDDPIDLGVSHVKVSLIKHAIPFNENLLIMSNSSQFIMSSDQMLTPLDCRIDQTTEFETDVKCKPVGAGSNVYFVVPNGNYSGIKEYFVQDDGVTNDAADVTAHVPSYVPKNVFKLISASNAEIIFAFSLEERNSVYCYKYYWSGNEKVQSAWGKWSLPSDCVILGGEMIDTKLYLIVKRADGTHLGYIDIESELSDADLGFQIYLDMKTYVTGVYNAGTDTTTWTVPYNIPPDLPPTLKPKVVMGTGFSAANQGIVISGTMDHPTTIDAPGDYSGGECIIGLPYDFSMTLSEQFVKEDAQEQRSIIGGRLQLLDASIHYSNTFTFNVSVQTLNREIQAYTRDAESYLSRGRTGTGEQTIGRKVLGSGSYRFPILSRSNQVEIKIINTSIYPSNFHSLEWTGNFVIHSQRK